MKRALLAPAASLATAVAVIGLCAPVVVAQKNNGVITLDPPGSVDTRPFGINPQGQIVGLYFTGDNRVHGFLFDRGTYSSIDLPGSIRTNAIAINPSGQIVGRYDTTDGQAHGYLLSDGVVTPIDVPGAAGFTVATDINPSGEIVGRYRTSDGRFHGFLLADGQFTTIDYPGAIGIQGMAINASGTIAGYYVDTASRFHGFVLDHGIYTTIDPPGSVQTGVAAGVLKINPAGDVAGMFMMVPDMGMGMMTCGFVYRNGAFVIYHVPGASSTSIAGINPQGAIVGSYVDSAARRHGFLAPRGVEDNQ
jgi:probable HAF family extracellular repeat protein